jgi:putative FmdB family regulatory protein
MPIYEYTCESCKTHFEQLHRTMSGDTKTKCPHCGSAKTVRSLSLFAVAGESAKSSSSTPPPCGHCGGPPGSCSA